MLQSPPAPPSKSANSPDFGDAFGFRPGTTERMPLEQHLLELRRSVLVSLGAWFAVTVVALVYHSQVMATALHPLVVANVGEHPVFLSPLEGMTIPLTLAVVAGFVVSFPVMAWQAWSFISPGLTRKEQKWGIPFVVSAVLLFTSGSLFAYFVMPVGVSFLGHFMGTQATYLPDVGQYIDFFMLLVAIFGVTFEFPLVLITLAGMRIISSRTLSTRRGPLIVGIILFALVITPGADPFTPTALAIPLILLLEASIQVISRVMHR